MKFGAWATVVLLVCLGGQGQASRRNFEAKFISFVASSSIKANIKVTNTSLSTYASTIKALKTSGQTEELQFAMDILTPVVSVTSDIGFQLTGALTNLITDSTTPFSALFEQVASITDSVRSFLNDKWEQTIVDVAETFGSVRFEQFKVVFKSAYQKTVEVIENVSLIRKIVLDEEDGSVNPGQLKSLVTKLELNIKDFNSTILDIAAVFKSTVDGVEKANKFLVTVYSKTNMTRTELNTTATQGNSTAQTQSVNIQNKYTAAQLSIKANLTNAIGSLSVFTGGRQLRRLVNANKASYGKLYDFLKKRSKLDLSDMEKYFSKLGNRTVKSINQTVEITIDSVNRTGLRLSDILLEGGSYSDSCYNTFSKIFTTPFKTLTSYVSNCLKKEIKRWTSIANAVDDMLALAQLSSQELAINLGRCSSAYVNYATSSDDYVKARACLKSNLRDMNDLPDVLEPLFRNVNQLVRREVNATIFRLDNCLASNLSEDIEGLKHTRSEIEICAGIPADGSRDDDENEVFVRDRDDMESNPEEEESCAKSVMDPSVE